MLVGLNYINTHGKYCKSTLFIFYCQFEEKILIGYILISRTAAAPRKMVNRISTQSYQRN